MKKPSTRWFTLGLIGVLILALIGFISIAYSYQQSKEYAVSFGQSQLEKINSTTIHSIDSTLQHQKDLLELMSSLSSTLNFTGQSPSVQAKLQSTLALPTSIIQKLFLISPKGEVFDEQTAHPVSSKLTPAFLQKDRVFNQSITKGIKQNGSVYFDKQTAYLNLYQPLYDDQHTLLATFIAVIDLSTMYQLIKDATLDEDYSGYTMIKNQQMEIIIHPSKDQIGLNIVQDRQAIYPQFDYVDLKKLETEQLTHDSGVTSYYSYWWNQVTPKRSLKITAYQWMQVGSQKWIVSSNAEFDHHNKLLKQELLILVALLSSLILLFSLFFLTMKNWLKHEQMYQENQQLLANQAIHQRQHNLEKSLLQESKLEIIGLLTTSIVHDMNNFLTPLLGNIELLMEEYQQNPALLAELNEIYLAAQKGHDLSQHVLHFSKANQQERHLCSLNTVIQEAIATMEVLIPNQVTIKLDLQIDTSLYMNPDELQAIIYNLLINSVQAMKNQGTILIQIKQIDETQFTEYTNYAHHHSQSPHVLLIIQDDGPGIPKDSQDKIFTPFFTTKSAEGGTGLGLFIVQSFIQKNDWLIKVNSSPAGTTFLIAFPLDAS